MKLNSLNSKESISSSSRVNLLKPVIAGLLLASFQQTVKADEIDYSKLTKQDKEKILKMKEKYPDYINLYGVGEKTDGGTYNGVGLKYHNDNFEGVLEKGSDYTKAGVIGKYDFSNGTYLKGGTSYVHYDNYEVGDYKIDPTQINYGFGLGYGNEQYNLETGVIWHKLTGAKNADTTSYTGYAEGIYRKKGDYGQLDLTGYYMYDRAYGVSDDTLKIKTSYYPTDDIQLNAGWSSESNSRENYKAMLGIKYTFGGDKEGKFSPYASFNYSKDHFEGGLVYEQNIANRPLSWKDLYEENMFSSRIHAEKTASKEFKQRVEDSFNQAPVINSIQGPTSVTAGTLVTYTVVASDKQNLTYTWKLDGKVVGNGTSLDIRFDEAKTYNLEVEVSDGTLTTTKTLQVKVNAEAVAEPTFTLDVTSTGGSASISETDTTVDIDFTGSSAELTLSLSSTEGGYTEIIWTDGGVRRLNNGESTTYDSRDSSKSGEVKYFDKDGNLIKTKTLNLNVI